MISKVLSSAVLGVDAYLVEVEVDIALGFPQFNTVGLPEGAVKESKERVRAAIINCGYEFPQRRITVNLAPADIRKEGSAFDLPISLGILSATGLIDHDMLGKYVILGELSLDGRVKPVKGALPSSICARDSGLRGIILPAENAEEAAVVDGVEVLAIESLQDLVEYFAGKRDIGPTTIDVESIFAGAKNYEIDFHEVKGQEHVKRALEPQQIMKGEGLSFYKILRHIYQFCECIDFYYGSLINYYQLYEVCDNEIELYRFIYCSCNAPFLSSSV